MLERTTRRKTNSIVNMPEVRRRVAPDQALMMTDSDARIRL
jgi:hypothetical protein